MSGKGIQTLLQQWGVPPEIGKTINKEDMNQQEPELCLTGPMIGPKGLWTRSRSLEADDEATDHGSDENASTTCDSSSTHIEEPSFLQVQAKPDADRRSALREKGKQILGRFAAEPTNASRQRGSKYAAKRNSPLDVPTTFPKQSKAEVEAKVFCNAYHSGACSEGGSIAQGYAYDGAESPVSPQRANWMAIEAIGLYAPCQEEAPPACGSWSLQIQPDPSPQEARATVSTRGSRCFWTIFHHGGGRKGLNGNGKHQIGDVMDNAHMETIGHETGNSHLHSWRLDWIEPSFATVNSSRPFRPRGK